MLSLLAIVANAAVVVMEYEFSRPQLTAEFNGDILVMENCRTGGAPGAPALPAFGVKLLLPPGEAADAVEVYPGEPQLLTSGARIAPNQVQLPFSYEGDITLIDENSTIYQLDELYPAQLYQMPQTQYFRGHSLACFLINPVSYNPVRGEIWWYPQMRIEVHTSPAAVAAVSLQDFYRADQATLNQLQGMVDNISLQQQYPAALADRLEEMDMVIITSNPLSSSFEPLADFNNRRGIHTFIETTNWIYTHVDGLDNQDRIRNFIIDCYQNLSIRFVLLGGDGDDTGGGDIIPYRGVKVSTNYYNQRETDNSLPCDLYYGGLDGNWNSDGDGQYGEPNPEEADFIAEVQVGRAAVDNTAEVANFVNKHIAYQQSPVAADCDEVLLAGELLWDDDGGTWTFARTYLEELRLGSSNHGYYTVGIDNPDLAGTLYDQYIYYPGEWSAASQLRPLLNNGVNYLNHLGHCTWNYMCRMYNSDITTANFTNNGENHGFYIVYSQGCICGAFDENDCFAENWTVGIPTGAVAAIANARYGWGYHYSTRGSSQYFNREFVDAIYGEGITAIARANDDSRVDCLPWINNDDMANRWCALELNLFGDPSLDIWTGVPAHLTAEYSNAYIIGSGAFEVQVPNVAGALVALTFEDELIARDYTDNDGNVTLILNPAPVTPGTLQLVITAHNYYEYNGAVSVIAPAGPYVVYESHQVNDANGELNPGESPWLTVTVSNCGVDIATEVSLVISEHDPYITILEGVEYCGDIPAEESTTLPDAFQIQALPTLPDGYSANVTLLASTPGRETWESTFTVTGHTPNLVIAGVSVSDGENNRLDAGETAAIIVTVDNEGTGLATSINGLLSSSDPYITINTASDELDLLPEGESSALLFDVTVSPATPIGYFIPFDLSFTADGYSGEDSFTLAVGLTLEDFETGDFNSFDWVMSGNTGWIINTGNPWEGSFCAQSGDIGDNQSSTLSLNAIVTAPDNITFYCKVSSEENYDYLRFYIDGSEQGSWDGEQGWLETSYPVEAGEHTFTWTYDKDYSVSNGSDCAWVDYIVFPPLGLPPTPAIAVDPEEFIVSLPDGGTDQRLLTISNYGDAELIYNLSLAETSRNFQDDMENGTNDWTHNGINDLWHLTTHRFSSSNHSWYVGNEGDWEYDNSQHCWLVSPEFYVEEAATLTFQHWIDAELYNENEAWDGGIVEISLNDYDWTQLTPEGGYPYQIYDNPASPFPAGTPCFAGVNSGWNLASFELTSFAGETVQLRFRFGSDSYVTEEGWYIDDVSVTGVSLDWLAVEPISGVVPPASDAFVTVCFDAAGYEDVTLTGQINLLSNDPLVPEIVLPVTLIVGGVPTEPITDLALVIEGPIVRLSWSPVVGATLYHIYKSDEPYSGWSLLGTTTLTSWNLLYNGDRNFFQVTWD